ncbi:MAG: FAD:protein FMN transferase [Planctomycetes bacterium]|nr:FAD:protein FMN transferase [Planctomycetota bacterium]
MGGADLYTIVVGRDAMACRFEVVFNAGELPDVTELACEALDLVDDVERRISIYRETSELAALNAAAGRTWTSVSADTLAMLELARDLHTATDGAFDITAGPLVRAWGFLHRQGRTPPADELAAARAVAGIDQLELDLDGGRARLVTAGAEVNPGAIGKGWAIDRAVDWLASTGVPSVLVHGGQSSVRARGVQGPAVAGRRGWRVGLRHPLRTGRRLATITLVDRALGTSGSGTQFFVERGRRLGHILDPRSGRPAEGVLSATVLSPSAARADALATALYALGLAGLEGIAPEGSETSAVLVLPGRTNGLRLVLANLPDAEIAIADEPGLEVIRMPLMPQGSEQSA